MARKFLTPIRVPALASDPGGAAAGDVYLNTISGRLRVYSGSEWLEIPKFSRGNAASRPGSPVAGDIHILTA